MTTADWALVVSCLSMLVSLAGFVWNVWSKFIYPKAKLKVFINISSAHPNPGHYVDFINLSATNHGPSEITLSSAVITKTKRRAKTMAMLNPLKSLPYLPLRESDGPFSGGLPKKLVIGEQFSVYLTVNKKLADFRYFGFCDSFGRYHWCSKKNAKNFLANLEKHKGESSD